MRKITALLLAAVGLLLVGTACDNNSSQDVINSYQATLIDRVFLHGHTDVPPYSASALTNITLNMSAGTADISIPLHLESGLTVNAVITGLRMTYNSANACYEVAQYSGTGISSGQFTVTDFKGQIDANSGYCVFTATVNDTYDVYAVNPPYFNYVSAVVSYLDNSKQPYSLSNCLVYIVPDLAKNTAMLTLIDFKSMQIEPARNVVIKNLPLQVTPEGYKIVATEAQSEDKEKFVDIDILLTAQGTAATGVLTKDGEYKIGFSASLFIK